MKRKKNKSVFQSIRKPLAKPTIVMNNKKEQLIMNSIELDDDDDEFKYAVDIPKHPMFGDEWECIDYFKTYEEALKFAQEKFGADDEGKVKLIAGL